jgi:4-amino-4-deoxy-L-arabinose transferase-like glycosyltransferase
MLKQIPWKNKPSGRSERLLVLLLLAIFLIEGGVALVRMSATGDETHYLGVGRYLFKNQKWDLADTLLQPPMSYYLHSLPLLPLSINDQVFSIPDINERGRALMSSYPDDRILMLARVPILLLAAGLGVLVFIWGKRAYGSEGGLFALFLYVFNPTIIGNAVQITPDLCLTFFSTLTAYFLWRYRISPEWSHSLAVGAALGLALLSKYSAVLLGAAVVILILAVPAARLFGIRPTLHQWRLRHLALLLAAAIFVANAGYLFHGSFLPLRGNSFHSHLFQSMERIPVIRNIPVPIPQPYVLGLDWQNSVVEDGFLSFMLGEKAQRGWFSYYLVAFFLKSPIPFLLLLVITIARGRDRLQWFILVPVIVFPLYFSAVRLSRGVRYILPVYPLLCIWVGQLVLQMKVKRISPALRWGFLGLLVWYAGSSIYISPHYLAYFNEVGGGPGNGLKLLFESDFDWGQDLKELNSYLKGRKIELIKFGCFSTADPAHYGIRFDPLPCEDPAKPQTGMIAASATALQTWGCYDWLKSYKPVDKVGYTIFIYNIPEEALASPKK